jgi:hypothetical protein
MRYRLTAVLLGLMIVHVADAPAAVTEVRATPGQQTLFGSASNVVQVRWQIATTPDHVSGVMSPAAVILDPATGELLLRLDTPLGASGGGPFVVRETLQLDKDTIRRWLDQGLQRVVLERSFVGADGVPRLGGAGRVVLRLSGSRLRSVREGAPGELAVVSLRLEFETGNNAAIVGPDTPLQAALTVQHTGTGVLRGRWQIAEPGSSEIAPVFRTLTLVNVQVRGGQRSHYRSPVLPTARPGVYVLRFCVSGPDLAGAADDVQCPDAEQIAYGTYQIQSAEASDPRIRGLSPNGSGAGPQTPFLWEAIAAAATYQLQVFEFAPHAGVEAPPAPQFVGGVLVRGDANRTLLGENLRGKLSMGKRYLWRVTAHDEAGRIVGSSAEATFVYGPAD